MHLHPQREAGFTASEPLLGIETHKDRGKAKAFYCFTASEPLLGIETSKFINGEVDCLSFTASEPLLGIETVLLMRRRANLSWLHSL